MRAAILAVGSELLGTDRLDTNSLILTRALGRFGVELRRKAVVGDDEREISELVRQLLAVGELVLVSGGLGPTADDRTREAVARALGRGLTESREVLADLEAKFARFEMRMPEVNRRQALVIDGAAVLPNRRGTAPGLRVDHDRGTLFLFPGVPHELEALVETGLVPWLERASGGRRAEVRVLKVACLPESTVEERLEPLYREFGARGVALLAGPGEVQIRLTGADRGRLERMAERVEEILGRAVFSRRAEDSLESVVGDLLRRAGRTVATAESCTGGLVAERLTRVPGSSDYFLGSAVTYADRLKTELLGVARESIERHGAVSREVVVAMAAGVRDRLGSDYGLAVSGVAGPGGGSEDKPVGTVHVAVAGPAGPPDHRQLRLPGDRDRVRRLSSQWALDILRRRLSASSADPEPQ